MVFHEDVVLWGPGEKELSEQWVRYWTQVRRLLAGSWHALSLAPHTPACPLAPAQFAKFGNPNGNNSHPSDPQWAPYGSAAADNVAVIDITAAGAVNITMTSGVKAPFCSFWNWNWLPEWRVY